MPDTVDPAETYLENLIGGNHARLLASFADQPAIDDPLAGPG